MWFLRKMFLWRINLFLDLKKMCCNSLNWWDMYVLFMLFGKNCESYPGKSQSQLVPPSNKVFIKWTFTSSLYNRMRFEYLWKILAVCLAEKKDIKYYNLLVVWKFQYVGTKWCVMLECSWTWVWSWRCAREWNMWVGRISGVFGSICFFGVPQLLLDGRT